MNKTLLTIILAVLCHACFAQKADFPFDKNIVPLVDNQIVYTKIDTLQGTNKGKIYDSILSWIALSFNNGKSVLQLSDKESGKIIVKGSYRDNYKFSVLGSATPYYYKLDFTMDITVKDDRYRCIISPSDVNVEGGQSWQLTQLYARIPDEYEFKKLGSAKRSEMYRAKQILNNTDVFAKSSFESIKEHILKESGTVSNDF